MNPMHIDSDLKQSRGVGAEGVQTRQSRLAQKFGKDLTKKDKKEKAAEKMEKKLKK